MVLVIHGLTEVAGAYGFLRRSPASSPWSCAQAFFRGLVRSPRDRSIYYAAIIAGASEVSSADAKVIVWTTLACPRVSILLHGITASPLSKRWLPEPGSAQSGQLKRQFAHPTGD